MNILYDNSEWFIISPYMNILYDNNEWFITVINKDREIVADKNIILS